MHPGNHAFELPPQPHFLPRGISLHQYQPDSSGRRAVEEFIHGVYASRFGADVRSFAPVLVCLAEGERIVAAAGYRSAALGPLFLERYLRAPVEKLLPTAAGLRPPRCRIVEVGHLASERFGEGLRLIRVLAHELAEQRFEWGVSTVTQELRRLFLRLHVVPHALGVADPSALGDDAVPWGTYYQHRPIVLAARLAPTLDHLTRRPSLQRIS
jgi:hypothetical protein